MYMKALLTGAALLGFAASANAETVGAAATLITPLTVGTVADMGFGSIVTDENAGTVTVSAAGVRTAGSGVTLGSATGVAAASVPLTGSASASFSITLSDSVILAKSDAPATQLTVSNFSLKVGSGTAAAYSAPVTGTLSGTGVSTLLIGGTLNIPANSPTGGYSTAHDGGTPLTVTVSYN